MGGTCPGHLSARGCDAEAMLEARFHEEYMLRRRLGRGIFGSVYSASRLGAGEEELAVKVLDLRARDAAAEEVARSGDIAGIDPKLRSLMRNEVRALKRASCSQHVSYIVDSVVHRGFGYIVMEKCERSLYNALEGAAWVSEMSLRPFFTGMLLGIAFIHSKGVIHRDVKPDSFMCSGPENTVKLIDFGLSRVAPTKSAERCEGLNGTPPFMCPEMILRQGYGPKADVWSFGVVAYALLFGSFPYTPEEPSGAGMQAVIASGVPAPAFRSEGGPAISHEATAWVRSLLMRNPEDRCECAEALVSGFLRQPSASTSCLRNVLHAAVSAGVFTIPDPEDSHISEMDIRLSELQAKYHERPIFHADRPLSSEASTEAGSGAFGSMLTVDTPSPRLTWHAAA